MPDDNREGTLPSDELLIEQWEWIEWFRHWSGSKLQWVRDRLAAVEQHRGARNRAAQHWQERTALTDVRKELK